METSTRLHVQQPPRFLLFFITILYTTALWGGGLPVVDAGKIKTGSLLGSSCVMAHYSANVSKEFLLLAATSCPLFQAPDGPYDCELACNYAQNLTCGQLDSQLPYTGTCDCDQIDTLCDGDWTSLSFGDAPITVFQNDSVHQFRFFLPTYSPFRVVINARNVGPIIRVSRDSPLDFATWTLPSISEGTNPYWATDLSWTSEPPLHVCPTDDRYQLGSWFVDAVCVQSSVCEYDISIIPVPLLSSLPGSSSSPTVPTSATQTQIYEGVPLQSTDLPLDPSTSGRIRVYSLVYSRPAAYDSCPNLFSISLRGPFGANIRCRISFSSDPTQDYYYDSSEQTLPLQIALSLPCGVDDVIYITLYQRDDEFPVANEFTAISFADPNAFFVLDPSTFNGWHYSFMMATAAHLECDNGVKIFSCGAKGSETGIAPDTCSYYFSSHRPLTTYGIVSTDILWPPFVPLFSDYAKLLSGYVEAPYLSQHLDYVLVLQSEGVNLITDIPNPAACSLKLNGKLVDHTLQPVTITEASNNTNSTFSSLCHPGLETLLQDFVVINATNATLVSLLQKEGYLLLDYWVDCWNFVRLNGSDKTYVVVPPNNDTLCPTSSSSSQSGIIYEYNQTKVEALLSVDPNCDSDCGSRLMETTFDTDAACLDLTTTIGEYVYTWTSFMSKCVQQAYHMRNDDIRTGFSCTLDSDCESGRCNVLLHQCVIVSTDWQNMSINLATCLATTGPSFLMNLVVNPSFSTSSLDEQVAMLLKKFGSYGTVGTNFSWVTATLFFNDYQSTLRCSNECATPDSPFFTLLLHPFDLPYGCNRCSLGLQTVTLLERVTGYGLVCSGSSTPDNYWFSSGFQAESDFRSECLSQAAYCGLCEDSFRCLPVPPLLGFSDPPTQTQCANIPNVCLSSSGLMYTSSTDVANCETLHGTCYFEGTYGWLEYWEVSSVTECTGEVCEARYYSSLPAYGGHGLCYFNDETCSYSDAIVVLGGCIFINLTQTECEARSESVIWLPDSSLDDCGQAQICSYPSYALSVLTTSIYTIEAAEECELCQGTMVPIFSMQKRFWVPGTVRTVDWIVPSVDNSTEVANLLNFQAFDAEVLSNLEDLYIANLLSVDSCLLLVPVAAVVNGVLQCQPSCNRTTDDDTGCLVRTILGIATVCSEQTTEMTAEPSFLIWSNTTVAEGLCITFSAYRESREDHIYTESDYLSSPFNIPSNFGNFTYPFVVVNQQNQAVVGDVVTDGVKFEGGTLPSYPAKLCFTYNIDKSSTFIFGIGPSGGGVVYGLDIPVYPDLEASAYCADVDIWIGNASYFLCQLRVDVDGWQDLEVRHFTGGERAYMIVIGCLYGLGFVTSLFGLYLSSNHVLFPMLVSISVCFLWRSIHLLVVAGSWGRITNPFLSEPPFFAYLSAVIYLFFVYRSIIKQAKMRLTKGFMEQYIIIVILLGMWLLTFVLLELLLPNSSGTYDHLCYGHIITQPSWPAYRILTLVYFVIFLCVCLTIGIMLMYQTHRLHLLAEDGETKAQTRQIMLISYALCFSITVYAILVISLKTPESTRNDLYLNLTVLWVLEWICPFILAVRSIINPWVARTTTSSRSKHTSTKRKPSSTSKSQG